MQKKAAKKSKILSEKQAEADFSLVEITKNMTVTLFLLLSIIINNKIKIGCKRTKRKY